MSGRLAMNTPWLIASIDKEVFGDEVDSPTREEVLRAYADFAIKD